MEWISVEDEMPDIIGHYLIYGGNNLHYTACAFLNSDKNWVDFNNVAFYANVTHWMPLPEPPK